VTRHVAFLSRLLLFWSAFNGIVATAVFAFAVAAASLALSGGAERPGTEVAAVVTAATLMVLALAAAIWSWVHYICASGLGVRSARAPHARARARTVQSDAVSFRDGARRVRVVGATR